MYMCVNVINVLCGTGIVLFYLHCVVWSLHIFLEYYHFTHYTAQYEVWSFIKDQASQRNSIVSNSSSILDPSLFIFQSRIGTLRYTFFFSRHKYILFFCPLVPRTVHTLSSSSLLVLMTKIKNLGFCLFWRKCKSEVSMVPNIFLRAY